jgi:hypothetical protein
LTSQLWQWFLLRQNTFIVEADGATKIARDVARISFLLAMITGDVHLPAAFDRCYSVSNEDTSVVDFGPARLGESGWSIASVADTTRRS